jgi:hypothetical protein
VRIEKIIRTGLHEAHRQQGEETMETLGKGPEDLYKGCLDRELGSYGASDLHQEEDA